MSEFKFWKHFIAISLLASIIHFAEARSFTNSAGVTIVADIVEVNGDKVILKMKGKNYPVPIASLSKEDQNFIQAWSAKKAAQPVGTSDRPSAGSLGNFEGLKLGMWPGVIEAGDEGKEYKIVKNPEGGFTYQSPHFEFHIKERLSNSVVKEFARIFEATYQFLDQAPLGLAPSPAGDGFYQTKLYLTKNDYVAVGGSPNSAGHFTYRYSFREKGNPAEIKFSNAVIEIPMSSLGVENTGTRFIIDHDRQNKTLIHEIVHQIMMRWLPIMNTWMSEGFAEMVESQDYSKGKYRTKSMTRAVKDNVLRSGKDFSMVPLEKLMTISGAEWSAQLSTSLSAGRKNYFSANLLLSYFAFLDGNGKAEGLVNYLEAVSTGVDVTEAAGKHLVRERSYSQLENEVAEAWRKEGVRITFQ